MRGVANFSQVHIAEPVHEANEVLAVRCNHRDQQAPQSLIVALVVLRLSPRHGLRTADTKQKTLTLGPRSSAAEDAFLRTEATDLNCTLENCAMLICLSLFAHVQDSARRRPW